MRHIYLPIVVNVPPVTILRISILTHDGLKICFQLYAHLYKQLPVRISFPIIISRLNKQEQFFYFFLKRQESFCKRIRSVGVIIIIKVVPLREAGYYRSKTAMERSSRILYFGSRPILKHIFTVFHCNKSLLNITSPCPHTSYDVSAQSPDSNYPAKA